jgi:hypothetical protein
MTSSTSRSKDAMPFFASQRPNNFGPTHIPGGKIDPGSRTFVFVFDLRMEVTTGVRADGPGFRSSHRRTVHTHWA